MSVCVCVCVSPCPCACTIFILRATSQDSNGGFQISGISWRIIAAHYCNGSQDFWLHVGDHLPNCGCLSVNMCRYAGVIAVVLQLDGWQLLQSLRDPSYEASPEFWHPRRQSEAVGDITGDAPQPVYDMPDDRCRPARDIPDDSVNRLLIFPTTGPTGT